MTAFVVHTSIQGEHEHSLFLFMYAIRNGNGANLDGEAGQSHGMVSTHGFERSPHEQPSAQRRDPGQPPLVRKTDGETHGCAHAEATEDDAFGRSAGVDFVGDEFVDLVYGA